MNIDLQGKIDTNQRDIETLQQNEIEMKDRLDKAEENVISLENQDIGFK